MVTVFSRVPKQLCILLVLSSVSILVFQSWLPVVQNLKESRQLVEENEVFSTDQRRHYNVEIIYESFKPKTCSSRKMNTHCLGSNSHYLRGSNQSKDIATACFPVEIEYRDIVMNDHDFPPKDQILPMEEETMNDPEFTDLMNTANVDHSQIFLEQPKRSYQVGDAIKIRVDLKNIMGKPRVLGGDDVRALMKSHDSVFVASGQINDLKNGSYQITFQALHEGRYTIVVNLPYTREIRATVFKWIRLHKTLTYYYGLFQRGDHQEFTLCSAYSTIPGFPEVCNMTSMNDGLPWFCGHPITDALNCSTFVESLRLGYPDIKANHAQYSTFNGLHLNKYIKSNITLFINKGKKSKQLRKVSCNKIKPRDTWNTLSPTGYVFKGQWMQQNCKNTVTRNTVARCLINSTLVLTGDSTTHHWLKQFVELTNTKMKYFKWAQKSWGENGLYVNDQLNITIRWAPHTLPFVRARKLPDGKMNLKSMSTLLKEISSRGRVIFLFHIYAHYVRLHYSLFWTLIRSLKPAIRDALKRNKDLKLVIKAPHMFYRSPCLPFLNDIQGPLFIDILQKEFEEFKDSIFYLNYWEINHALQNDLVHPRYPINWDNIRHFLGYVC